ncbi:zf-CCHC_4 domain-containing protein, partial [Cephalotus follicularis]
FQYERLPNFCHQCGRIGHAMKECNFLNQQDMHGRNEFQYGAWLRAESFRLGNSLYFREEFGNLYDIWSKVGQKEFHGGKEYLDESYKGGVNSNIRNKLQLEGGLEDGFGESMEGGNTIYDENEVVMEPYTMHENNHIKDQGVYAISKSALVIPQMEENMEEAPSGRSPRSNAEVDKTRKDDLNIIAVGFES